MRLYHYTCSCCAEKIRADGRLRPWRQVALDNVELVWLTDLDTPDRNALGLTSKTLKCDRTEYRVTVDSLMTQRWVSYARWVPLELRRGLELAPGALPMHWWISLLSVAGVGGDPTCSGVTCRRRARQP